MSEQRYKAEHLQDYTGILTSDDTRGSFKMELKVEDNPVLEKSIEKIEPSIELEFKYDLRLSTLFFHDIHSCPSNSQSEQCHECKKVIRMYDILASNIYHLQVGDTFRIRAALINDKVSELPVRIRSFKDYEPLTVACHEYKLRLADTIEGINKKREIEEQKLQREREEEERRKNEEENRIKEEDRRKKQEKWDRLKQWLAKYPNIIKIGGAIIGATVLNQIPNIIKFVKYIYHLRFPN